MEKSRNYPQMPPEMNPTNAGGSEFSSTAPPSYEQATTAAGVTPINFPIQVLPTPTALNNYNDNAPTQHQPQNTQVFVGGRTNSPYVGVAVGGGGGGGPIPINPSRAYPTQQQQMHQPMMQQQQMHRPMMQQPVVIIQQQAMLPLGPDRTYVVCPACQVQGMTNISHEPSSKTHLMAALLCILGFWCCVCLPYCADSCMNTNHYCGNCNKFLGSYSDSL